MCEWLWGYYLCGDRARRVLAQQTFLTPFSTVAIKAPYSGIKNSYNMTYQGGSSPAMVCDWLVN